RSFRLPWIKCHGNASTLHLNSRTERHAEPRFKTLPEDHEESLWRRLRRRARMVPSGISAATAIFESPGLYSHVMHLKVCEPAQPSWFGSKDQKRSCRRVGALEGIDVGVERRSQ